MAVWRAKCWLGSSSGYQELEVKSSTYNGAVEQFKRIYGAEQIINLHQVNDTPSTSSNSSNSGDAAGWIIIALIFLIIAYWHIIVPILVILGIIKFVMWYRSNDKN